MFRAKMDKYPAKGEPSWKNPKSARQGRASLETPARTILDLPVDQIDVEDLVKSSNPLGTRRPKRRGACAAGSERSVHRIKTKGNPRGENPAALRDNLKNIFKSTPPWSAGILHQSTTNRDRIF